jgi:hypothetical protein
MARCTDLANKIPKPERLADDQRQNPWSGRCIDRRPAGSEWVPGKRTDGNVDTAPLTDATILL